QYMRLICTLQSAVTFEWRRNVPGREIKDKQLIDGFEKLANRTFCHIIEDAFNEIANSKAISKEEIFFAVQKDIAKAHQRLSLPIGLLSLHLNKTEGGVRYWSQQDIINLERDNYGKYANSNNEIREY